MKEMVIGTLLGLLVVYFISLEMRVTQLERAHIDFAIHFNYKSRFPFVGTFGENGGTK